MHPGNNEYTVALAETEEQLLSFSYQVRPLPGMSDDAARKRLARLIVEIVTNEGLFIGREHSASTVAIAASHQKHSIRRQQPGYYFQRTRSRKHAG